MRFLGALSDAVARGPGGPRDSRPGGRRYKGSRGESRCYDDRRYKGSRGESRCYDDRRYKGSRGESRCYDDRRYKGSRGESRCYDDRRYKGSRGESRCYDDRRYKGSRGESRCYDDRRYKGSRGESRCYDDRRYKGSRGESRCYDDRRYKVERCEDQGHDGVSHPKRNRDRSHFGWGTQRFFRALCAVAGTLCLLLLPSFARAQEGAPGDAQESAQERAPDPASGTVQVVSPDEAAAEQQAPAALDRTPATVHGIVRNGATGEPVARALVRIEGDAQAGSLTDNQGRFEIPDIPVGPQAVSVEKPGFRDRPAGASEAAEAEAVGPAHSVMVAVSMPDLEFTLDPTSVIHGQVELSTGEPGDQIELSLLRRVVSDGRGIWQIAGVTKTRSDGSFRFAGLPDGVYALYTEPSVEGDLDTTPGSVDSGTHWGYASVFYPDARNPSGAAQIALKAGEETEVTLTLAREAFQTVTVAVDLPQGAQMIANLSATVMDSAGHDLAYRARFNSAKNSVQAILPDGSYSMLMTTTAQSENLHFGSPERTSPMATIAGTANFVVAGRALSERVKLGVPQPSPVELNLERSEASAQAADSTQHGEILVTVSPAEGWVDNGIVSAYGRGSLPGPLEAEYTPPGSYWANLRHGAKGVLRGVAHGRRGQPGAGAGNDGSEWPAGSHAVDPARRLRPPDADSAGEPGRNRCGRGNRLHGLGGAGFRFRIRS